LTFGFLSLISFLGDKVNRGKPERKPGKNHDQERKEMMKGKRVTSENNRDEGIEKD